MTDKSQAIADTLAKAGKRRRVPLWLWLAAIALLAGGGWAYWSMSSKNAAVTYTTEPVTRAAMTVVVTATGTVQPTNQVEISSELSGTLASVEVDFNDTVTMGQVLARLDTTKLTAQMTNAQAALSAATANVAQAEATLSEAEENYATAQQLDQRGVSTHSSYITAKAVNARAKAALAAAMADVSLAGANLEVQRADLSKAEIRSPINGVVLDRDADAGNIVASSLSAPVLFVLAEDLTKMELQVDVDEADIGRVQVSNPATFTVEAYPGRVFDATITSLRYAPETTDGVVTYKAVLSVDNADLALRPGMTATASIIVSHVEDALQVPNAALRYVPPQTATTTSKSGSGLLGLIMPKRPSEAASDAAAGHHLYVLRDGVPTAIEVETGDSDSKHTVILKGDVAEGDAVITDQSGTE